MLFRLPASITLLLLASPLSAQIDFEEGEVDPIPVLHRPTDFSGASGRFFQVEATLSSNEVHLGEPVTLTLRAFTEAPVVRPPASWPLSQVASLHDAFKVELVGAGVKDPDRSAWTFVYRLHPQRPGKFELPSLPFWFHDPAIPSPQDAFQPRYTDPFELTVLPPEVVRIPVTAPERFFTVDLSERILAREQIWRFTDRVLLAGLVVPPLAALCWYLVWRRLHPNEARLALRRRSRAARRALAALERIQPAPGKEGTVLAVRAVTHYLQQRLDLAVHEATPREVAFYIRKMGYSAALARQAFTFFELSDAHRFKPDAAEVDPAKQAAEGELSASACSLILAVEEEA
jgi:hypothetical protein